MPKYTFECSCRLKFTRNLSMGEHPTLKCPNCGKQAARVWERFGFKFADGGKAPGNTGVSKNDYPTADQAVGRSAEARWNQYHEREKVKEKVREVSGERALVRKNGRTYLEYQAGGSKVVETRKQVAKELTEVLKRPPA